MAEQILIAQVLEKEVTCPLCLELYEEPKKLSCDHVCCMKCLGRLAQCSSNGAISCPECRNITDLPNNDVNNLPTAFRLNRLVEAFKMTRESMDCPASQESSFSFCAIHKAQPLALFCETCRTMLCRDCVIMNKEHMQHDYNYIEKIMGKYQDKHTKSLQITKEYEELLSKVHSQILAVENTIFIEKESNLEEIDRAFEDLHNTLEESKRSLKRQLSQMYDAALENLLQHKRQTESMQNETTHILKLVEGALKGQNKALLVQDTLIDSNVGKLRKQMEQFSSTVCEPSLPLPEVMSYKALQRHLHLCNFLYTRVDPKKCVLEERLPKIAENGELYVLTLNMVDTSGNKCLGGSQTIKAELCSRRDNTTMSGRIDLISPGNVTITFDSPKRGRNELSVTVRGVHVANSPQSIYIHIPPSQLDQPAAEIQTLDQPSGLTQCGNCVLAVEYARNRILKFNSSFELAAVFRHEELLGPSELTTDKQSNMYVCTLSNDKLHKFTSNGVHIKSTGSSGVQSGQFNFPNGLRINTQEELYVCDSKNNRIQVFDLHLNFKRVFGGPGNNRGQFLFPSDVDFDCNNKIYVCDNYNHRIQVFTHQERPLSVIGCKTFRQRRILEHPVNLRIINDFLFVTQNHHVTVFKISGELVRTLGKGILQQPEGLEVDVDGYVYVSSHCSKVVVF